MSPKAKPCPLPTSSTLSPSDHQLRRQVWLWPLLRQNQFSLALSPIQVNDLPSGPMRCTDVLNRHTCDALLLNRRQPVIDWKYIQISNLAVRCVSNMYINDSFVIAATIRINQIITQGCAPYQGQFLK